MNLQLHFTKHDNYDGLKVFVSGEITHEFFVPKGADFHRVVYARIFHRLADLCEIGAADDICLDDVSLHFTADVPDFGDIIDHNGRVR